jgi:glutathione S-transferase
MDTTLIIGNKNYSSWSLRAYLALSTTGIPFTEILIPLKQEDSRAKTLAYSPSGLVPALQHNGNVIWDSLAIGEYLAETFPAAQLWPQDARARAVARSVSAEMHSGFLPLRMALTMNLRKEPYRDFPVTAEVAQAIERICSIWRDCRARFGTGGEYLFGKFSLADVMYAPVATRFRTYGVALDSTCAAYVDAIHALPAFQQWKADALKEEWVLIAYER